MPVIAVNVSPAVFIEIQGLVERGVYASPEKFLEIASFNQLALEKGASAGEILARGHRDSAVVTGTPLRPPVTSDDAPRRPPPTPRRVNPTPLKAAKGDGHRVTPLDLQEALGRLAAERCGPTPAPLPSASRASVERVYGLVNRHFPLKLACRWIAVRNARSPTWQRYDDLAEALASDAATMGSELERVDLEAHRKRDDLLSTGLPRRGNIPSTERFLSQYIARTTRGGSIYPGAICQYGFAYFDSDRLALTERGVSLAQLPNPLLDADLTLASEPLGEAERAFLVQQVVLMVPGELNDWKLIINAISAGHATPERLQAALRKELPTAWTDLMVRSHASGLVSRAVELGLLQRQWEGRHVFYSHAPLAQRISANILTQEEGGLRSHA